MPHESKANAQPLSSTPAPFSFFLKNLFNKVSFKTSVAPELAILIALSRVIIFFLHTDFQSHSNLSISRLQTSAEK